MPKCELCKKQIIWAPDKKNPDKYIPLDWVRGQTWRMDRGRAFLDDSFTNHFDTCSGIKRKKVSK